MLHKSKSVLTTITFMVGIFSSFLTYAADERPNIVVILLDDLGYADVGFQPNAEKDIYTPNIDALAHQGTVMTQAYVTHPYCGPSRAGLMTGRYQHNHGSQFNLPAYTDTGVDVKETFFSKVLQDAGYKTGLVGKWHLGEEEKYQPINRGFDYFYGMLGGGHVYFTNGLPDGSNKFIRSGANKKGAWDYKVPLTLSNSDYNGDAPETDYDKNLYITDMLSDAGVDFIDRAESNDEQPFLLFMSYNAPHTPEEAKESDRIALQKKLGANAAKGDRLTYTAMVYGVDRGIQKIVNKLKETGEFDNTLIVFLSDNGGRMDKIARAKNTPLRGSKTTVLEGGIRVPMFIHWPDGKLKQKTYKHVVSSLDLYPMFTQLAKTNKPAAKVLDGKDIMNNLREGTNARVNEPLYFVMHKPLKNDSLNASAVILNNWKYYTKGDGYWVLRNLDADISEKKAIKNNKDHLFMLKDLMRWTCQHITPITFDNPNYNWERNWHKNNMPNWEKTFGSYYSADNCQAKITTAKQ